MNTYNTLFKILNQYSIHDLKKLSRDIYLKKKINNVGGADIQQDQLIGKKIKDLEKQLLSLLHESGENITEQTVMKYLKQLKNESDSYYGSIKQKTKLEEKRSLIIFIKSNIMKQLESNNQFTPVQKSVIDKLFNRMSLSVDAALNSIKILQKHNKDMIEQLSHILAPMMPHKTILAHLQQQSPEQQPNHQQNQHQQNQHQQNQHQQNQHQQNQHQQNQHQQNQHQQNQQNQPHQQQPQQIIKQTKSQKKPIQYPLNQVDIINFDPSNTNMITNQVKSGAIVTMDTSN